MSGLSILLCSCIACLGPPASAPVHFFFFFLLVCSAPPGLGGVFFFFFFLFGWRGTVCDKQFRVLVLMGVFFPFPPFTVFGPKVFFFFLFWGDEGGLLYKKEPSRRRGD